MERALGGVTEGGKDSSRRRTKSNDVSVGCKFSSVSDKKKKDYRLQGMVMGNIQPMKPKNELLDVIRGLRTEQMNAQETKQGRGKFSVLTIPCNITTFTFQNAIQEPLISVLDAPNWCGSCFGSMGG